jgi:hypothetical protein
MGGHTEGRDPPAPTRRSHGRRPHGGANPRPVTSIRVFRRPTVTRAGANPDAREAHRDAREPSRCERRPDEPPGGPAAGTPHSGGGAGSAGRSGAGTARITREQCPALRRRDRSQVGDPLVATSRGAPSRTRTEPTSRRLAPATSASSSGEGWPDSSAGRPRKAAGDRQTKFGNGRTIAGHRAADRATAQRARVIGDRGRRAVRRRPTASTALIRHRAAPGRHR